MPDTPPPRRRPSGGAVVLLAIPAGLGGLLCAQFAVQGTLHRSSDLPGQEGWMAYFLVTVWWAVAAAVTALVLAFRRPARTVLRMATANAALVLALFWPVQLAGLVGYAATRRSLPRALRVLAVPMGVAVLIACGTWGVRAWDDSQVYEDGSATATSLAGDWHTASGGRLHLGADGRFRATCVPHDALPTAAPRPDGTVDATGRWSYDPGPHGNGLTLTPDVSLGPADAWDLPTHLAPFRAGGSPVLCTALDPDDYCGFGAVLVR
ncbi:hypothetical protein [Streptomyces sp. NPDC021224]|uniref:hypothetical protein n=1 Tax=unclassified Streptomyces TaxID=2593676 RepID=UPI00379A0171